MLRTLFFTLILSVGLLCGCAEMSYLTGDYETALNEWRLKAEQGDANAQQNLGHMYDYGLSVPEDDKVAVKWYTLAAEQGLAESQYSLGVMYEQGFGVLEDDKVAVKWYTLAAEQGYVDAQNNLGGMYSRGHGVTTNVQTGVKWYTRAAEQKNTSAMFNLGEYERHNTKDYIRAHMWYTLSTSQGRAMDSITKAAINIIEKEMSPAQIKEAHKLTRDCKAKNYKGC